MQLHTEKRNLLSSSITATEEFTVQTNAHMMEILSGLYSNIPWAIVREYGTNMLDGYIALPENAKVIPPQIHVPTILEPYIEFKDFGVGMDFQTVWQVYKTYGASTKTNNNEEVGGFGLGAKTAFCYEGCDSWTIESRYNGHRMLFSAARNEKGVPTLFHMNTTDTDEPNGVTIKIPVAQKDIDKFKKAITKLVQFYPMEVVFTGDSKIKVPKPKYIYKGENWRVRKGSGHTLVMGNVPYPLDMQQIMNKASRNITPLHGYALDIRAPIGMADIVPSREALKYTDRTVKYVAKILETFKKEVVAALSKELENQATDWEVVQSLAKSKGIVSKELLQSLGSTITWKGKQIKVNGEFHIDVESLKNIHPSLEVEEYTSRPVYGPYGYSYGGTSHNELQSNRITRNFRVALLRSHGNQESLVLLDDVGTSLQPSLEVFVNHEQGRNKDIYVFNVKGLTDEELKDLIGGYPVTKASAFIKKYVPKDEKPNDAIPLLCYTSTPSYTTWSLERVSRKKGGYYFRANARGMMDITDKEQSAANLIKYAKSKKLIPDDAEVYRLPREYKKLEKDKGWIDLGALLNKEIKKTIESQKTEIENVKALWGLLSSSLGKFFMASNPTDFMESSTLRNVGDKLREASKNMEELDKLDDLACSLHMPIFDKKVRTNKLASEILSSYPMLSYLRGRLSTEEVQKVTDYIRIVDEKKLTEKSTGTKTKE